MGSQDWVSSAKSRQRRGEPSSRASLQSALWSSRTASRPGGLVAMRNLEPRPTESFSAFPVKGRQQKSKGPGREEKLVCQESSWGYNINKASTAGN